MKNMFCYKKGFTLLEIIFVVILIAGLLLLFFPNIIFTSKKAEIGSVVTADAKSLTQAITEWRKSSADSDGTFQYLTTSGIVPYLPTAMSWHETKPGVPGKAAVPAKGGNPAVAAVAAVPAEGYIQSTGLNGGIHYRVISDKTTTNGDSFKLFIDFSEAIKQKNYDSRTVTYAESNAADKFVSLSLGDTTKKTAGQTVAQIQGRATKDLNAIALGIKNEVFTLGTGNLLHEDGKLGVRGIRF